MRTSTRTLAGLRILAGIGWLVFSLFGATPSVQADTLRIRRVSPSGTDVQPGQQVVIQFDRIMIELGDKSLDSHSAPVSIKPDPGCEWHWLNTRELACRLPGQTRFAPATRYTITVPTSLKAIDGSHLDQQHTATFETWRPTTTRQRFVEWRSPALPVWSVELNEPVDAVDLARHLRFRNTNKGDVWVEALVEPFEKERTGPLWLPDPEYPGAVIQVDHPVPNTPRDADKPAGQARQVWQVVPAQPLLSGEHYALQVTPGLTSPLGTLSATQGEDLAEFKTYGEFTFDGVECRIASGRTAYVAADDSTVTDRCRPEEVSLLFSSPVPEETLAAIKWEPAPLNDADMSRLWKNYPQWRYQIPTYASATDNPTNYPLTFNLEPMSRYTLNVPVGVKDSFGRTLEQPASATFRTTHRTPFLSSVPSDAVLEAGEKTIVPLLFSNLDNLSFSHRRLFAEDLTQPNDTRSPDNAQATITNILTRPELKVTQDAVIGTKLGVREWLDGRSGVVWGRYHWSPDGPDDDYAFMAQVTPYQILAKVGHYDSLVWVSTLADGTAVQDARINIMRGRDHDLSQLSPSTEPVNTDAHGLAKLPGAIDLPKTWFNPWDSKTRYYLSATHNKDMALLPLTWTFDRSIGQASQYEFWSDNEAQYGHMRAWAVTSQGIYRPGSEIHYVAFVRDTDSTALKAPPPLDYTLTIIDPTGNEITRRERLSLSDFGDIGGKVLIPSTAPMGNYDIYMSWTGADGEITRLAGRFLVTDFIPASFSVSTLIRGTQLAPGDTIKADMKAALHAGGPYADAQAKFTARLVAQRFSPDTPVAAGYTFGNDDTLPDTKILNETENQLDRAGHAEFDAELPTDNDVEYGQIIVEGQVRSARSTWVSDTAYVTYTARDRFLGLRTDNWMQTAGTAFDINYLVTDPQGKPQAGSQVRLQLQRQDVSRVRTKSGADSYDREEQVSWVTEQQCTATSAQSAKHCQLTPEQAGHYRILGTVTDTNGNRQHSVLPTWVTGAGQVVWSTNDKGVTLVPDKSDYQPGETARVLVQNPYPQAQALVTVERYGILWKKVVTLRGSAPVIEVPIQASYFPGAYLSVAIFSPRVSPPNDPDLGKPELALGYQTLKIMGKGSALNVAVTPEDAEYKPGETVSVDVSVRDEEGKAPEKTRLVAAVIDQGVLDLLADGLDYYDPSRTFYAPPTGPDMANYSMVEQLLTRLEAKEGKGKTPGGGGGASAGIRSNFSHAAYWNTVLTTNADGNATFEFDVPDNLTRWRIIVIAMRPDMPMGVGNNSVQVNLPLQIEPALPNQVRAGDTFDAGFAVTNRTDRTLSIETSLSARGAITLDTAHQDTSSTLEPFQHQLDWLRLTTTRPGNIELEGKTRADNLTDAVQIRLPVLSHETTVTAAEYDSTVANEATLPLRVPAGALAGSANIRVSLAPTLLAGLDGAFKALRDNPLQSWEMQLSRAVLAANYLHLKPVLGDTVAWPQANELIQALFDNATSYQAPNGGMAYWSPRPDFVSDYLSVYTALAFGWLHQAGHTPPADVEKKLWGYLEKNVMAGDSANKTAPLLQAATLAAQAAVPHRSVQTNAVAGMLPELPRLPLFGQALLLQAAVASGDKTSADRIVESLFSFSEESAGKLSFSEKHTDRYAEVLSTPLRANCAIADGLSQYQSAYTDQHHIGDTTQKLMRWVNDQRQTEGSWPNSQENVFCTTATTHYANIYETEVDGLEGTLFMADDARNATSVARFTSRSNAAISLDAGQPQPGDSAQITLRRRGKGRLYYGITLDYAMPADALPAASAGLTLQRDYFVQRGSRWQKVDSDTMLERGDIIRIDLTVDSPATRHHVLLNDPLPGTFEAVNRELATSTQALPDDTAGMTTLMFDAGPWPNMSVETGGFYHRDIAFDAVRFYAENLPAGRYRLVYSAQVIAPGRFVAPAPTVKEVYQPDIFGRDTAQYLEVRQPER